MFQNQTEDVALNKLIILYTINVSPDLLTKEKLTEVIMTISDTNYFIIQQYLSELMGSKMLNLINHDGNTCYQLNDNSKQALEHFTSKIPKDIVLNANKYFNINDIENKNTKIDGTYYLKNNGEYNVNLKIVENSDTIFSLYISVPNKSQADSLCQLWEESPDHYYKSILDLFIKS